MKPLYALHKDEQGNVHNAANFEDDYSLGTWVRKLDLRHGDFIEFGEIAKRPDDGLTAPERPAFIEDKPTLPKEPELAESEEEKPF